MFSTHLGQTSTRAWSKRCVRGPKGHPSSGDSCWDSDFFNKESTSTVEVHKQEYYVAYVEDSDVNLHDCE